MVATSDSGCEIANEPYDDAFVPHIKTIKQSNNNGTGTSGVTKHNEGNEMSDGHFSQTQHEISFCSLKSKGKFIGNTII